MQLTKIIQIKMQVALSLKTVNYKHVLVGKTNLLLKSNQGSTEKTIT